MVAEGGNAARLRADAEAGLASLVSSATAIEAVAKREAKREATAVAAAAAVAEREAAAVAAAVAEREAAAVAAAVAEREAAAVAAKDATTRAATAAATAAAQLANYKLQMAERARAQQAARQRAAAREKQQTPPPATAESIEETRRLAQAAADARANDAAEAAALNRRRQLAEKSEFDAYKKRVADKARVARAAAAARQELARERAKKAETERLKAEAAIRREQISRDLLATPFEAEVVALAPGAGWGSGRDSAAGAGVAERVRAAPLAVLSPEQRAKVEADAAVVTLTAFAFKVFGPLGALAAAAAAKTAVGEATASGSIVRGLGRFFYGTVELAQAVDRKFAVGETVDDAVQTLLRRAAVETSEGNPDVADIQELKAQRAYAQVKKTVTASLQAAQDVLLESVGLIDRVLENVKNVE